MYTVKSTSHLLILKRESEREKRFLQCFMFASFAKVRRKRVLLT